MYKMPDVWIQLAPLAEELQMDHDFFQMIKKTYTELRVLGLHVRCNDARDWAWSAGQPDCWPDVPYETVTSCKFKVVGACVMANAVYLASAQPAGSEILGRAIASFMAAEVPVYGIAHSASELINSPDHFGQWATQRQIAARPAVRQNMCHYPRRNDA
jgi:hypothetical protein